MDKNLEYNSLDQSDMVASQISGDIAIRRTRKEIEHKNQ